MAADLYVFIWDENAVSLDELKLVFMSHFGHKWGMFPWSLPMEKWIGINGSDPAEWPMRPVSQSEYDAADALWHDAVIKVHDTCQSYWVGENSILKAALFEDESFVPSLVEFVWNAVDDGVTTTEQLIEALMEYDARNDRDTGYQCTTAGNLIIDLSAHPGFKVFCVNV
jgi:hypothetical protein